MSCPAAGGRYYGERYYRVVEAPKMQRRELTVRMTGRAFIELTQDVAAIVRDSGAADGLCHVLVPHPDG
jgi:hypothetical protein